MRATADHVLSIVPSTAEYADVRVVQRRHEGLHVENGNVGQAIDEESIGIGVRVLLAGHWGFAATSRLERDWFGAPNREAAQSWLRRCEAMLEDFEARVFARQSAPNEAATLTLVERVDEASA